MSNHKLLSEYPTAQAWLQQFAPADQEKAAAMINSMLLLNEEQVSASLRSQLYQLADVRQSKRRRIALYAEREFGTTPIFEVKSVLRGDRLRRRAVGSKGPAAVKPIRGNSRVGSEGLIAFVISQAKETKPDAFMNHPGPDLLRSKSRPAGSIGIVTDFIGSGSRIRDMLDAFWSVPSIRSWISYGWIDFKVIAAAATAAGVANVQRHRVSPEVIFQHVVPTITSHSNRGIAQEWLGLIKRYGPDTGRDNVSRYGFGTDSALVAFNYRIPNNTPALLHKNTPSWRALYVGAAPHDLRSAFDLRSCEDLIGGAANDAGIIIANDIPVEDAALVLTLTMLRGRWYRGAEVKLAERTGMLVPDVLDILAKALKRGLITNTGRLTDKGQALLASGRRIERKRPQVVTNLKPYYPEQLRTPRASFSTRRPTGRP